MSELDLQRQIDALKKRLEMLDTIEQPAIACRVYNDADIAHTSTGNWQALTFNTDRLDTYGMHSTTSNTNRITFTIGGWYLVTGHLIFAASADGMRGIMLRKDGSTIFAVHGQAAQASGFTWMSIAGLYYFSATNYIELLAFQSSGGNLDLTYASAYGPELAVMRLS